MRPGRIPEDPIHYRFEYLCLIDNNNNFDLPCLAATVGMIKPAKMADPFVGDGS